MWKWNEMFGDTVQKFVAAIINIDGFPSCCEALHPPWAQPMFVLVPGGIIPVRNFTEHTFHAVSEVLYIVRTGSRFGFLGSQKSNQRVNGGNHFSYCNLRTKTTDCRCFGCDRASGGRHLTSWLGWREGAGTKVL